MSIEGVTGAQIIQRLQNIKGPGQIDQQAETGQAKTDRLNISDQAHFARTLARVQEQLDQTPEVRADRVAEVQQNLADGIYDSDRVIEGTADSLAGVFLGE